MRYQGELVPLQLYDTRGLELDSKVQSKIKKEIFSEINGSTPLKMLKGESKKILVLIADSTQYNEQKLLKQK